MRRDLSNVTTTILLMLPYVLVLGLALDLYLPSIPTMAHALNVPNTAVQLTMSLFLFCFGLGQLVIGPSSDCFGRKKIIILSAGLFIVGSIICSVTQTLSTMLIGRVLQAFGACGTQVVAFAMVRDQFDGKSATVIFTSLKGAMAIAPIAAPILGAFLQVHYGWKANFVVLTLYGVFLFVLSCWGLKENYTPLIPENFIAQYIKPYHKILKNINFIYFGCCGIATQAAMFGYFSLSPRYYISEYGLSESQFAFLFSCNAAAFLITGLLTGKWIYRLGFSMSTLIGALMLIIAGVLMVFGDNFYSHHYVLFLPNLIASSSAAIMLGASASGAMMPFKINAGAAAAMFGCMEFIGGGIIGSLAIRNESISVQPLAMTLILLGFGISVFYMWILRMNRRIPALQNSTSE